MLKSDLKIVSWMQLKIENWLLKRERILKGWLNEELEEEISADFLPIKEYIKIFKALGFEHDDKSFNINGWEAGFSCTFTKENLTITLVGSLYYGMFTLIME